MSFVDIAEVTLLAGNGGNGAVSFRHEKFIDKGGPDGGDGGHGGNIILRASRNQDTLASFRYQKELRASSGKSGEKTRRHGRSGADLIVPVPVGTVVIDSNGSVLADFTEDQQQNVIAAGGRGGFGNAHFISSTRQAPRFAEKGEITDPLKVTLELKLIADVGLIGLPNAGKSTLLSVVSNARPEIADYPFTTLKPNLGVVDINSQTSLLFADIPGLIEGAAEGKGLGDEFLRHVERTLILVHLIDAYQDDIVKAYKTIQKELKLYKIDLTNRPQIVVINKVEGIEPKNIKLLETKLKKIVPKGTLVTSISAKTGKNLDKLLKTILKVVKAQRLEQKEIAIESEGLPVIRLEGDDSAWQVIRKDKKIIVHGARIESFAGRTDFSNTDSVDRLRDIMRKVGIMHEISRLNAREGDIIVVGNKGQFPY